MVSCGKAGTSVMAPPIHLGAWSMALAMAAFLSLQLGKKKRWYNTCEIVHNREAREWK